MSESKDKIALGEESGKNTPAKPEGESAEGAKKTDAGKEGTIAEALGTANKGQKQEEGEMVPLSALMEVKKENRELAREMKVLKKAIEEGATKAEVSEDIKALADKHDVDPEFLRDFAATIRAESKKEAEKEVSDKLKPVLEKDRAEQIDKAFNTHFNKTLDAMPEYKDIAKKEVIKALSLSPENANKTFTQLIEEVYGHLLTGKHTIDKSTTSQGKNTEVDVDIKRAQTDQKYFKEVMNDPILKKKYNESLVNRLAGQL